MTKMTKREKFEMLSKLSEVQSNEILRDFIAHEMELLEKKSNAPKKPTSAQIANEAIKTAIVEFLSNGEKFTIGELMKFVPDLPETMTPQRLTALVTQLKNENKVVRTEDKRKAYFSLA